MKGTFGMAKFPDSSVVVVLSKALTGLRIVTLAFGTTAPDGSTTVPVTELDLPDCPYPETFKTKNKSTSKVACNDFFKGASMIPPKKIRLENKFSWETTVLEPSSRRWSNSVSNKHSHAICLNPGRMKPFPTDTLN